MAGDRPVSTLRGRQTPAQVRGRRPSEAEQTGCNPMPGTNQDAAPLLGCSCQDATSHGTNQIKGPFTQESVHFSFTRSHSKYFMFWGPLVSTLLSR